MTERELYGLLRDPPTRAEVEAWIQDGDGILLTEFILASRSCAAKKEQAEREPPVMPRLTDVEGVAPALLAILEGFGVEKVTVDRDPMEKKFRVHVRTRDHRSYGVTLYDRVLMDFPPERVWQNVIEQLAGIIATGRSAA